MTIYNLFPGTPQLAAADDTAPLSLGTEFYVTATAWLTQLRFLQPASGYSTAQRTMGVYLVNPDGITGPLIAGPYTSPAPVAGTWCTYVLPIPVALTTGQRYRATVFHPAGLYAATGGYFNSADTVNGIVTIPNGNNALANQQGSYNYGPALAIPDGHFNATAYYSDATITDVDPNLISGAADITVTASLDPRRWGSALTPGNKAASLAPRRWAGTV